MAISVVQGNTKDLVDIRMLRHVVGPGGTDLFKDNEYRLNAQDAAYMIYAGQAVEIGEDAETETAQEKNDRLQLEAAELARAGKRRASPQAPVEAKDGSGAVIQGASVTGNKGAVTNIGAELK